MFWGDLIARSAGLRRLGRAAGPSDARTLDQQLSHRSSLYLRVLARWAGSRRAILAVLFDDADRRVLTILMRGAASSIDPQRRRHSAFATPTLPSDLLDDLAQASSLDDFIQRLQHAGHDAAGALAESRSGLLHQLSALDRWWAQRAATGASRGGIALRRWVCDLLDERNLAAVLALAGSDVGDAEFFLGPGPEGELVVDRETFQRASTAPDREAAAHIVSKRMAGLGRTRSELRRLLRSGTAPAAGDLLDAALRDQRRTQVLLARLHPLSPAPILVDWLDLLADFRRRRRTAWREVWALGDTP